MIYIIFSNKILLIRQHIESNDYKLIIIRNFNMEYFALILCLKAENQLDRYKQFDTECNDEKTFAFVSS